MRGKVIKVNHEKGFGFIRGADGVERFFHKSGLQRTAGVAFEDVAPNMDVEFEAVDDAPKGPRAMEVLVR